MAQSASLPNRRADTIPRGLVRAVVALLAFTMILVAFARVTGMPPAGIMPVQPEAERVAVVIAPRGDGGVLITRPDGSVVASLSVQEAGFISGVERVLARERRSYGLAPVGPVDLVRWQDGRMSLLDPATGWRMEIVGFGDTNVESFARLLAAARS